MPAAFDSSSNFNASEPFYKAPRTLGRKRYGRPTFRKVYGAKPNYNTTPAGPVNFGPDARRKRK